MLANSIGGVCAIPKAAWCPDSMLGRLTTFPFQPSRIYNLPSSHSRVMAILMGFQGKKYSQAVYHCVITLDFFMASHPNINYGWSCLTLETRWDKMKKKVLYNRSTPLYENQSVLPQSHAFGSCCSFQVHTVCMCKKNAICERYCEAMSAFCIVYSRGKAGILMPRQV